MVPFSFRTALAMSGFTDIASAEQLLLMDDTRSTFDAEKEVATMKARRADMRRKRWRLSKLMKYRAKVENMEYKLRNGLAMVRRIKTRDEKRKGREPVRPN